MMKIFRHGFTLVELLIVVSIISILSAIAIPNFAEATMRAKTSRAHNDLRVLALNLEVYATDHNRYPENLYFLKYFPYMNMASSVDIFQPRGLSDQGVHFDSLDGSNNSPTLYLYENFVQPNQFGIHYGLQHLDATFGTTLANDNYLNWLLASRGPDLDWYNGNGVSTCSANGGMALNGQDLSAFVDYDPTNGTVSAGNIFRTNVDTSKLGFGYIEIVPAGSS